jgi:hypothetical protein
MNRKAWIIIITIVAIVLLYNLRIFGYGGWGDFMNFALSAFIVYRAVVLYKKAGLTTQTSPRNPFFKTETKGMPVNPSIPKSTASSSSTQFWGVTLVVVLVLLLAFYRAVGAAAYNFFVWGDHLLSAYGGNPVVLWALPGLAIGAVTGSLAMWKKYHIRFGWCLVTILPFLLAMTLLQVLSAPLQAIAPRPLVDAADTAKMRPDSTVTTIKHKKRRFPVKKQIVADTGTAAIQVIPSCAQDLKPVSVMVRSDSVSIHYRTASYQNGPWSDWKVKFIAQAGQYLLMDNGQVTANGIEYYYEIRSALTRSAEDPFKKELCNGPLTIDTY